MYFTNFKLIAFSYDEEQNTKNIITDAFRDIEESQSAKEIYEVFGGGILVEPLLSLYLTERGSDLLKGLISPLYSNIEISNIEEFLLNILLVEGAVIDHDNPDVLAAIYGLIETSICKNLDLNHHVVRLLEQITLHLDNVSTISDQLRKGDKLSTFNLLQFLEDISKIIDSDQIHYIKEKSVTALLKQFSDYKSRINQKELKSHGSNLVKTKELARKISKSSIRTEIGVITPRLKLNIEDLSVRDIAKLYEVLERVHKAINNGAVFSHNSGYLVLKDNRQGCHRICLKQDGYGYFIAFSDYISSRQHIEKNNDYYIKLAEKDPLSQKAGTIVFDVKPTDVEFPIQEGYSTKRDPSPPNVRPDIPFSVPEHPSPMPESTAYEKWLDFLQRPDCFLDVSDIAGFKEYIESEADLDHLESLKAKIEVLKSYEKLSAKSKRILTKAEGAKEQKFQIYYDREISSIRKVLNNKIIQLVKKVNAGKRLLELMKSYGIVGELCLTEQIRTLNNAGLEALQNQFKDIQDNADGEADFLTNKLAPFIKCKELLELPELRESESVFILSLNEDTLTIDDDAELADLVELFKELSSLSKDNIIKFKSQITDIKKNIQDKIHEEYKRISKVDLDQLRSLQSLQSNIEDSGIKLKGLDKKIQKLESSTARNRIRTEYMK